MNFFSILQAFILRVHHIDEPEANRQTIVIIFGLDIIE